jgi:hypothetical protein
MNELIIIANYLPQFHPVSENDNWWGKGFTEWTNVATAKPLFKGHYQPKIPGELGFYDLRYPEIKEQQAELARDAGISAFCYWHYWLGNGKRLLYQPLEQVVQSGEPDFPFCIGWANHDWQRKDWDSNASIIVKEVLLKQFYGGVSDYTRHFYDMLPTFRDKRYFQIDQKLVFTIFRPDLIPDTKVFFDTWNDLAIKNNIPRFLFIACTVDKNDVKKYLEIGYDRVNLSMLNYPFKIKYTKYNILKRLILNKIFNQLNVVNYSDAISIFDDKINYEEKVVPTIIPNWDHSPRSGKFGHILHNSTPKLFRKHAGQIFNSVKDKKLKLIFLKSWNEWGEGNYMEPDLKYGRAYITTLAECVKEFKL